MPKRADRNQADIVAAFRGAGASVQDLHTVGHGCPDLVIGWAGRNLLVEIKSDGGSLTPKEQCFHDLWRGQVVIVRTVDDALTLLGVIS